MKKKTKDYIVKKCVKCGASFKAPSPFFRVCEYCLLDYTSRSKRLCWLDSLERDNSLDSLLNRDVDRLLSIPLERLESSLKIDKK